MSLKIMSIASGSKGNCTYVASENTKLLVDVGVSPKRIQEALSRDGCSISDLKGVLITHEHDDHICYLRALADKGVPIFAHERIMSAIVRRVGNIPFESVDFYDAGFNIGDISVYPFRIPHDTVYPLAYSFECDGARISVATDIGHITEGILSNLKGSQIVLLEANHDLEMLIKGDYRANLKTRIRGANGHLSNDSTALIVRNIAKCGLKRIILGHLSEENNCPELAFSTVVEALRAEGLTEGVDVDVELALQNKTGEIYYCK